jgi:hypothetical protein
MSSNTTINTFDKDLLVLNRNITLYIKTIICLLLSIGIYFIFWIIYIIVIYLLLFIIIYIYSLEHTV